MNLCCTDTDTDIDRHMAHITVLISCFTTICTRTIGKCALQRFETHQNGIEITKKNLEMYSWHMWCHTRKNYNLFRLFVFYIALVQYIYISISIWILCERKNDTKMFENIFSYHIKCESMYRTNWCTKYSFLLQKWNVHFLIYLVAKCDGSRIDRNSFLLWILAK